MSPISNVGSKFCRFRLLASVATALLFWVTFANAEKASNYFKPSKFKTDATVFGPTLAPKGYVDFCSRGEDECKGSGIHELLHLTDPIKTKLQLINGLVNSTIRAATDRELYKVDDYWTYPVVAGDCEDYALLKKRYLTFSGISPDELLLTAVLDEEGQGHAVLTILTDQGDFVLDNRRAEVLLWNQTDYTFLKRQSQEHASQWESLQFHLGPVIISTNSN